MQPSNPEECPHGRIRPSQCTDCIMETPIIWEPLRGFGSSSADASTEKGSTEDQGAKTAPSKTSRPRVHFLGRLASGEVVVDRYNSHLHKSVLPLLPEALSQVESAGRGFILAQVDFGRIVGESVCVPTEPGTESFTRSGPRGSGSRASSRIGSPNHASPSS